MGWHSGRKHGKKVQSVTQLAAKQSNRTRSLTDMLPVEITQVIFRHYTHDDDRKSSPWNLGAICRAWRSIAWADPHIWTHPNFYFEGFVRRRQDTRIQLAKEWIQRSANLPLSITLHALMVFHDVYGTIAQLRGLIDLVNENSYRWFSLDLTLPSKLLAFVDSSSCTSSILHELSISTVMEDVASVRSLFQVKPKIVRLFRTHLNPLSLNWTNVTSVSAFPLAADDVLHILQNAPGLCECAFPSITSAIGATITEGHTDYVVHTMVESLQVSFDSPGCEEFLLRNVTLPGLKHLVIGIEETERRTAGHLSTFIIRSHADLESFTVRAPSSEDIIRLAALMPNLQALQLLIDSPGSDDQLHDFYDSLSRHLKGDETPVESEVDSSSAQPLLPILKTFSWSGNGSFPWGAILDLLCPLSQSDDGHRRPLESVEVFFHSFPRKTGLPYVDEEVISRLVAFSESVKFNFTVWDSGKKDLYQLSVDRMKGNADGGQERSIS
ncbi:hypothetical protein CVT26_015093 [Gymnopilus dilepis]|uniref:Uncharacterized protein n=1 Tax=Gymnopilus dilepis TaxID=231916 RepID=A0A409YEN4_9AGAR|nr:hypothetical protein CVT26_015093 [Gymnopilus dilepis]